MKQSGEPATLKKAGKIGAKKLEFGDDKE